MTMRNETDATSVAVSVIMPAYNAGRYIETAIRSVMAQTFSDWELIVIDDGSKDITVEVAEQLAREDSRITLLRNETNMGVAKTRNRGLALAKGEYVALLDSDDVWYPQKLEKQVILARETRADVVYCSYAIVDENGKKKCDDFVVPAGTDFHASLIKGVISCSTALLSRTLVDTYRFDDTFYHEDLALWLQILKAGHIARGVTDVLAEYRVMDGTRAANKLKSAANRWQIYRELLGFSVWKSATLLMQYGVLGLKKYKRTSNDTKG